MVKRRIKSNIVSSYHSAGMTSINRLNNGRIPQACKCITDECMMWKTLMKPEAFTWEIEEDHDVREEGYCGLIN